MKRTLSALIIAFCCLFVGCAGDSAPAKAPVAPPDENSIQIVKLCKDWLDEPRNEAAAGQELFDKLQALDAAGVDNLLKELKRQYWRLNGLPSVDLNCNSHNQILSIEIYSGSTAFSHGKINMHKKVGWKWSGSPVDPNDAEVMYFGKKCE